MADISTLLLGFPIWGETAPPVIRSFLMIPFITHGGYGDIFTALKARIRDVANVIGGAIEPAIGGSR